MSVHNLSVILTGNATSLKGALNTAGKDVQSFGQTVNGMETGANNSMAKVGKTAAIMAGGIAVVLGASAKAAIDWESAWAGVSKTVDGSASEMAELEGGLRDLAKTLPATHGEIAAVAEAAGQLGIQREAIVGFTETMVALGETTNLTADQAATSMARIANIMQTPTTNIDRMASTLVALGNAGASTEAEILEMATRIAAAGKIVGLSEADVLGFANALSSVGIEAEAGGSAISRVFSDMATAVAKGGDKLEGFAATAGMSSEAFAKAFRDDAAGATITFVEGLEKIRVSGGNVFQTLEDLELGDLRVRNALLSLAGAGDVARKSIEGGSIAWADNTALMTEAEKRYDTTAAKLEVARNNIVDLGVDIGSVLLPAIAGAAEGASTMARGFGEMPGPLAAVTAGIGGVALAGAGAIAAAAFLVPKIKALRVALLEMGAAGRVASAAMPWLAVAAAAIAATTYVFGQNAQAAEAAEESIKGYTDAIREAGSVGGGAEAKLRELAAEHTVLSRAIDGSGMSIEEWAAGLSGSDADFEAFIGRLQEADEAGTDLGLSGEFLAKGVLPDMRSQILTAGEEARRLGRVLGPTGDAALGAAGGAAALGDELNGVAVGAVSATDRIAGLGAAIASEFGAQIAYERAVMGTNEALAGLSGNGGRAGGAIKDFSKEIENARESVEDANEALMEAQAALDEARKPATARDVEGAEIDIEQSRIGAERAAIRVTDSEQKLSDLRAEEKSGVKEVRDAEKKLAALRADGTSDVEEIRAAEKKLADLREETAEDAEDVRDAELDLEEARLSAREAVFAVQDAEQKLIEIRQKGTKVDREVVAAIKRVEDANEAVADAHDGVTDAMDRSNESAGGYSGSTFNLAEAMLDAKSSAEAEARALADLKIKQLEASGATVSTTEKQQIFVEALKTVRDRLAPGSALRTDLDGLIGRLEAVPGEYSATLVLNDQASPTLERLNKWIRDHWTGQAIQLPIFLGPPPATGQRWGGIMDFAQGGVTPAHITKNQLIKYGEPGTGGEAYVPRLGDPARSASILTQAASWYGYGLVKMAHGGITSYGSGGEGGGTTVISPEIHIHVGEDVSPMGLARIERAAKRAASDAIAGAMRRPLGGAM